MPPPREHLVHFTARITEEQANALAAQAVRARVSVGAYLRVLLQRALPCDTTRDTTLAARARGDETATG